MRGRGDDGERLHQRASTRSTPATRRRVNDVSSASTASRCTHFVRTEQRDDGQRIVTRPCLL